MPNIGPLELAIVAVIVLLIVGTARLTPVARSLGSGIREFKDAVTGKRQGSEEGPPPELPHAAADRPKQRS